MSALQSAPPTAAGVGIREYDSEIKDIASYVHNYQIESDLAVSYVRMVSKAEIANFMHGFSWILLDTFSWIP